MSYLKNIIKYFKIYSLKRNYTIILNKVLTKENIKGNIINFKI